jgi:hypothetical protein
MTLTPRQRERLDIDTTRIACDIEQIVVEMLADDVRPRDIIAAIASSLPTFYAALVQRLITLDVLDET